MTAATLPDESNSVKMMWPPDHVLLTLTTTFDATALDKLSTK